MFQRIFEESGYEVYEGRESITEFVQTEQQKEIENQKLTMAELTERIHDRYWSVEEMGDAERMENFISMLETSLNSVILQFNKSNEKVE
jgi:hypothetical protein